jgi:hypothetical protein
MLQTDFRNIFLDNVLGFLWRQWSALGVLGEASTKDSWVIDPEGLLVFTFKMARCEPRLFDEVMDWLVKNGKWIDIQRLRGILKDKDGQIYRLMGAVSEFLASRGQERKWQNLSSHCCKNVPKQLEALFMEKNSSPYPAYKTQGDNTFKKFGFYRPALHLAGKSRDVVPNAKSTLRFMLRGLFGVGSRAECVLYLLTHDGGHPSDVAEAIGLSVRGTQDALIELSRSGLVLTRIKGKRKIEYWLSQERWWEFLSRESFEEIKRPVWIDWIALFSALSKIWETLNEIRKTKSEYMKSSKLRDAMEIAGNEFARSGIDIPAIPGRDVRPENYEQVFIEFISKVFGSEESKE